MSTSETIRAMLEERGIEYEVVDNGSDRITFWNLNGIRYKYRSYDKSGCGCLSISCANFITPEQAIVATLGARDYTYDEWRAINEAVGDAMEYAYEHAVMYPDKADPLWNIDEYVNRVLEVAYGPKDATMGVGTCEWCKDGKTFDRQTVMTTNHGWQRIRHCPNCGRKLVTE